MIFEYDCLVMNPPPARHSTINHDVLRTFGERVLAAVGVSADAAALVIDSLVEADLRGVHSHGMQRLPWYTRRVLEGGTNADPDVRVVEDAPAVAVLDGDGGLGQVVSDRAMTLAIEKAKLYGIGSVAVRNSHHFGACAYWVQMALSHQMIGIATTNGGPIMAPWGGVTKTTGNDPIGVAIPAGDERPIVLDMATTIVAGGKLDMLAHEGKKIPFGWALDRDGRPTDDPAAGRAGLLLPIGEHKGYGLTVVFEILSAVLGGANVGRDVPPPGDVSTGMNVGHYFQAINVAHFMPVERFEARVDEFIRQLKSSELAPGVDRILLPGEIEFQTAARYRDNGVPIAMSVIDDLHQIARRVGVSDRLTSSHS